MELKLFNKFSEIPFRTNSFVKTVFYRKHWFRAFYVGMFLTFIKTPSSLHSRSYWMRRARRCAGERGDQITRAPRNWDWLISSIVPQHWPGPTTTSLGRFAPGRWQVWGYWSRAATNGISQNPNIFTSSQPSPTLCHNKKCEMSVSFTDLAPQWALLPHHQNLAWI